MITIQYPDGSSRLGFILSLSGNLMRVAMRDREDAASFRLKEGSWQSDEGEAVLFMFGLEMEDAARMMVHAQELRVAPRPSACAAGGDCVFRGLMTRPAD